MKDKKSRPGKHNKQRDELETLIRARYSVIYVVTWEETRVEYHLQAIAAARGKEIHCWSVTTGLTKSGTAPAAKKGVSDPIEALDTVIEHKEAAIYLF